MPDINTHHLYVEFGKHKGELWTRVPVTYLKWLADQPANPRFPDQADNKKIALAELQRRNVSADDLREVNLSDHAIDRAATGCMNIYNVDCHKDRQGQATEGLCSWLRRITEEAVTQGEHGPDDEEYRWKRMRLIIRKGEICNTLVTVMRSKHAEKGLAQ